MAGEKCAGDRAHGWEVVAACSRYGVILYGVFESRRLNWALRAARIGV